MDMALEEVDASPPSHVSSDHMIEESRLEDDRGTNLGKITKHAQVQLLLGRRINIHKC